MGTDERPIFYYDLASPYSYLAAFRLTRVLPVAVDLATSVDRRPFRGSGREWRRPASEVRASQDDIARRAAGYGMPPWRWPQPYLAAREHGVGGEVQPANTLAVMRVATLAHGAGVGEDFALRAWHLAFGEGHDISRVDDAVVEAAVACGLDAGEVRAAPGDPEIKAALRSATEAASARGVTGLPTVAVGERLFWGDDRLEEAADLLGGSR